MNLSVLKSATGEPCLECYVALLYFFIFYIYKEKAVIYQSQSAGKSFLSIRYDK